MLKEGLATYELEEYAKDNGYNSTKFICRVEVDGKAKTVPFTGKFLDAYYGFIQIPLMGDGFVRLQDIQDEYGDRNLFWDIPETDEEYHSMEQIAFILRGKQPPQKG